MIHWKKYKSNAEEPPEENNNVNFVIQPNNANILPTDNKIYLYGEIHRDSILTVCKQLDEISKQLKMLEFIYDIKDLPPIELHINCDGGELTSAFMLVDKILRSKLKIHTIIEGMAASAATIISTVGHRRFINKHSYMLLHQLSSSGWGGTYQNIVDEKTNCDVLMDDIKEIYLKHSKFKEKELAQLLKHDLLLRSSDCLKMGLVDEVL